MSNNTETFVISLKDRDFLKGLVAADRKTDNTKVKVQGLTGAVGHLRTALAGVSIAFLGREVIRTLADFERFEAVLTNTLGSNSAAKKAMAEITDFAARTPFAVDQLTDSYVKLANQGLVPTQKEMTSLGDLAASTGKDFSQLTEALIDGQVGEFERLKEFGIRASKQGDKVKFTFKGVQTQVDFTEKAMQGYILGLGEVAGVSGAMAAISKTTGGQISNLGDSVTQLYLNLGTKLKPAISGVIGGLGSLVENLGAFINWLAEGGTGATIFKVALAALTGGLLAYNVMVKGQALITGVATMAQWLLNAAMTANPIGIVVVAIGALVAAFVVAYQQSDKFRAVIKGLWAAIKQVGENIVSNFLSIPSLVINAFKSIPKAIADIFSGVGSLFNAIFGDGKLSDVPDILKGMIADNALAKVGKDFVVGQIEGAQKVAGAFGEAYNNELLDSAKAKAVKDKTEEEAAVNGKIDPNKGSSAAVGNKKKGLGAGISEIKASAPKTFNINIGSLIKEQTISTTNLASTALKIKEEVTKVLLTAVNDAQIIAE
jgi:hypothetical protein